MAHIPNTEDRVVASIAAALEIAVQTTPRTGNDENDYRRMLGRWLDAYEVIIATFGTKIGNAREVQDRILKERHS